MSAADPLDLKFVKKIVETDDIKTFRFLPKKKITFASGQFVNFYSKDAEGKLFWRAYSVSSSPTKRYIEITVKMGGQFATLLENLKIGDVLEGRGPFGGLLNILIHKEVVVIAGGVGVTPFMSAARYATEKKLDNKITFFYSCKTEDKTAFLKELQKLAKKNSNLKLVCTLTQPGSKNWRGETGRVNSEMIRKYIQAHAGVYYYLCGPQIMIDDLIKLLKDIGVPEEKIKKEAWG